MIFCKRATLLLATLVLTGSFAGCTLRSAHSAASHRTVLKMWVMGGALHQAFYNQLAERFNREHPDLQVQVDTIPWDQAHSKLVMAAFSGAGPDVAIDGGRWTAELAAMDALEPLDPYLHPNTKNDFLDVAWQSTQWHGHTWGLPQSFTTTGLFYRTDWLQHAGCDHPPQTWAEFRDVAKKESTDGRYGFGLVGDPTMETTMFWTPFLWQNGGDLLTPDGKRAAFNSPAGVEALQFYIDLYRTTHAVPEGCLSVKRNDSQTEFLNGVVGLTTTGPMFLHDIQTEHPTLAYRVAPYPVGQTAANLATTDHIILLKSSKHKQAAFAWIDFVTNPQNQQAWNRITGFIPARKSGLHDPVLTRDPNLRVLIAETKHARSYPTLPEWPQIDDQLAQAVHAALAGKKTPKEALDDAARKVNDILAQSQ